ncbi:hypothetical protein C8T65DRAFT_746298 [Cerioporus squamosus]|nr:hypothetical protein C8T65DRAFT_746298 [Cerioporus squamosus]
MAVSSTCPICHLIVPVRATALSMFKMAQKARGIRGGMDLPPSPPRQSSLRVGPKGKFRLEERSIEDNTPLPPAKRARFDSHASPSQADAVWTDEPLPTPSTELDDGPSSDVNTATVAPPAQPSAEHGQAY